jgi:hypothetical protein
VDVSKNPKVSNEFTFEREDRRAMPPDVTTRWWDAEELLPMMTMKAELAKDLVALFNERQNV